MCPGDVNHIFLFDAGGICAMALELRNVSKRLGADTHIFETNMTLERGSFNVLLGTTLAGKTTLMQIIAGIQKPTTGSIWFNGADVTKRAVQQRNVSMVYQQFINYPNFNVYDNIASPLRVAHMSRDEIDARVQKAATLLRLTPMLHRKPSELSGGQQQRTAIARALVKDSDIILLDEPLANLDYKLREELREELPKLFADRDAIVVYATTEPSEALLFGGQTATLHEGRVTQFGPTGQVYRKPANLTSAQVFSEPPMNTARVTKRGKTLEIFGSQKWPAGRAEKLLPDGDYIIGIRPHNIATEPKGAAVGSIEGQVLVTELSGSESIIHAKVADQTWISQSTGIHPFNVGATAKLFVDIDQSLFFSTTQEFIG
jgi:glycerol transport system ATP-binding protein